MTFAAVILAGGAGRRLGGVDKPALLVAGATLLDRALAAVPDAAPIAVVGPTRPTTRPVTWTREDPPGGGPIAALAAGLRALEPGPAEEIVAVLAADLLGVRPDTVSRLRSALGEHDGALLVDENDHVQWLTGVWRTVALRAAIPEHPDGLSVRRVLGQLDIAPVRALAGETADVDTPADLARARQAGQVWQGAGRDSELPAAERGR